MPKLSVIIRRNFDEIRSSIKSTKVCSATLFNHRVTTLEKRHCLPSISRPFQNNKKSSQRFSTFIREVDGYRTELTRAL